MTPRTVKLLHALVELDWDVSLHRVLDRAGPGGTARDPIYPLTRFDVSGCRLVCGHGRHGELEQAVTDAIACAVDHALSQSISPHGLLPDPATV